MSPRPQCQTPMIGSSYDDQLQRKERNEEYYPFPPRLLLLRQRDRL